MSGDALTLQPELGCNSPEIVQAELLEIITDAINNHPRSLQTTIGPSEIGHPCTRNLLHKLNGDTEPPGPTPWLPTIGTAFHTWAADTFTNYPHPRYLVEREVTVGEIAGEPVTGHSDLFDELSGTVVDWKLVGATTLTEARKKGPSEQYRVQRHAYGRGFALQGYHVNQVAIMYLPRNAISLGAYHYDSEPYDEQIVLDALARCTQLVNLTAAIGIDAALSMYPECGGKNFCKWCAPVVKQKVVDPNADPLKAK